MKFRMFLILMMINIVIVCIMPFAYIQFTKSMYDRKYSAGESILINKSLLSFDSMIVNSTMDKELKAEYGYTIEGKDYRIGLKTQGLFGIIFEYSTLQIIILTLINILYTIVIMIMIKIKKKNLTTASS